jgi:hypothetical protein
MKNKLEQNKVLHLLSLGARWSRWIILIFFNNFYELGTITLHLMDEKMEAQREP